MTWKDYSHFVLLWCCFALVFLTLPLWLPLFWLFMLVRLVKTRVSANSSSRATSRIRSGNDLVKRF